MKNTFIKYEEALKIIASHKATFKDHFVSIMDCGGRILAEDLIADRDFPPYDRVTMDGIAILYKSFESGNSAFPIEKVAPAGSPQQELIDDHSCIEVMTGAILPKNTDTVIKYEELIIKDKTAHLSTNKLRKRQNIHFKGMDVSKNTIIKKAGEKISSAEINIAASVGKDNILVKGLPLVAVISTGDELVDVHESPLDHQIRRSNVYGIRNTFEEWGIQADLKHLPDDKELMQKNIAELLIQYDILVITGGVSKGKFDFLPDVLTSLGVVKHFHKIQQRPGKPFWFGTKNEDTHIFALPGNPVSSFVCLYIYIKFWLQKSWNIEENTTYVSLEEDITFKPDLVYFIEAKIQTNANGTLSAKAIYGNGSGDFINLINTDGFLILPQDKIHFKKGETYPFIPYRDIL